MASTITVQGTINFCQPYVFYRPLAIGVPLEPAITIANTVLQAIVGPPFCWRWNRATTSLTTTSGTSPYVKSSLNDFGFIENASASGFELEVRTSIPTTPSSAESRPAYIAAQFDDNAGSITFVFTPVPDAAYTVMIEYQKKPTLISSLSSTWAPIPDEYSYIYQFGFLSMSMAYANDPRAMQFSQMFKGHLLGASEGLTETQRAAFADRWDSQLAYAQAYTLKTQQGVQGRAL